MELFCKGCKEPFEGRASRRYCKREIEKSCEACGAIYGYTCNKRPLRGCSPSCAAKLKAKQIKTCQGCTDQFQGDFNQTHCQEPKIHECLQCKSNFERKCVPRPLKGDHCSSLCRGLARGSSKLTPEETLSYIEIDSWALKFAADHGRAPALSDLRKIFRVRNLPSFASRELFSLEEKRRSWAEEKVATILAAEAHEESLRNKRPILTEAGRRLELDFWIPSLALAFEVQEEATHSLTSDDEEDRWGVLKKGPAYHEEKRRLAQEQLGVTLIDLWEEEVRSGDYKKKILETLEAARGRLEGNHSKPL